MRLAFGIQVVFQDGYGTCGATLEIWGNGNTRIGMLPYGADI
jgi:hypothetical protein